jgi:thioredoxin reductase
LLVHHALIFVSTDAWDVVIVGAGPAGLSAALVLGRARRRVLLCDQGTPRNRAAKQMHGFLSRDGIEPDKFRAVAHEELREYEQVTFRPAKVAGAKQLPQGGFRVTFARGTPVHTRKLLLATGLFDRLPPIRGIDRFFGTSVFQCPYCHGWEFRDRAIAVYGQGQRGFEMARAMTAWTDDIVLCTDGPSQLSGKALRHLQRNSIHIVASRLARLEGRGGRLRELVFRNGDKLRRDAMFFDTPSAEQSSLSRRIGCEFGLRGGVKCGQHAATSVPGVFAAGNITRDVQLAVVAAAEGVRAAFGINRALTREDFSRKASGRKRVVHAYETPEESAG